MKINGSQVLVVTIRGEKRREKQDTSGFGYGTSGEVELRGGGDEARPSRDGIGTETKRRRPPWHVDGDRRCEWRARSGQPAPPRGGRGEPGGGHGHGHGEERGSGGRRLDERWKRDRAGWDSNEPGCSELMVYGPARHILEPSVPLAPRPGWGSSEF